MRPEWQMLHFSPWGIVDFTQEGCLLLKMWFRPAWHFPVPFGASSLIEIYYWQVLGDILSFRPIAPQQVKLNNRRIDYMRTTEQQSENVFTVVSLPSKCQESALSRRSAAWWMINELEYLHKWPNKQISTQVGQQWVLSGSNLCKTTIGYLFFF